MIVIVKNVMTSTGNTNYIFSVNGGEIKSTLT